VAATPLAFPALAALTDDPVPAAPLTLEPALPLRLVPLTPVEPVLAPLLARPDALPPALLPETPLLDPLTLRPGVVAPPHAKIGATIATKAAWCSARASRQNPMDRGYRNRCAADICGLPRGLHVPRQGERMGSLRRAIVLLALFRVGRKSQGGKST
jgi:hypothetical protein